MISPHPSDQELHGMTINERLFVCGVLDKWDDAKKRRNREDMLSLLRGVAMNDQEATWSVDTILAGQEKYGV